MTTAHPRDQAAGKHQGDDQYANQQGQWVTRGESNHVPQGAGRSQWISVHGAEPVNVSETPSRVVY